MFMVNVILYLWIGMLDVTDVVSLCCSTLNWLEWIDQLIGLEWIRMEWVRMNGFWIDLIKKNWLEWTEFEWIG